jgi:hypothetical protein
MNPSKEKRERRRCDWEGNEPAEEMEGGEEEAAQLLEPAEEMEGGEEEAAQLLTVGVGGRSTSGRGAAAKAGAGKGRGCAAVQCGVGSVARPRRGVGVGGGEEGWAVGGGVSLPERVGRKEEGDKNRGAGGGRAAGGCPQKRRRAVFWKMSTKSEFRLIGEQKFWNSGYFPEKI